MTTVTYTQHCHNKLAHQNASLQNMCITYKGKDYSYKEFNEAFPIEGTKIVNADSEKRKNKKIK